MFDRHEEAFFQKKKVSLLIRRLCVYGCIDFFEKMVYFLT